MFSNLPDSEREAFYDLLDDYFISRPHLLPNPNPNPSSSPSIPNQSSISSESVTLSKNDIQTAGRFAASPLAQKMVGHALGHTNTNTPSTSSKGPPPPPPGRKSTAALETNGSASSSSSSSSTGAGGERRGPGGIKIPSGLSTGKAIGSLKTSSKGEAFSSFIHKPRGSEAAALKEAEQKGPILPPVNRGGRAAPPPVRRTGVAAGSGNGEPMGEAIYAYQGTDDDDFNCSEGEQFYLTEKISDDWWKARSLDGSREGLVPSNYVKEL